MQTLLGLCSLGANDEADVIIGHTGGLEGSAYAGGPVHSNNRGRGEGRPAPVGTERGQGDLSEFPSVLLAYVLMPLTPLSALEVFSSL